MEKDLSKPEPQSTVSDVLRAFWRGMREYKGSMWLSVVSYLVVDVLVLVTPLYYKKFFDTIALGLDKESLLSPLLHIIFVILFINSVTWALRRTGSFSVSYFESKVLARLREISFEHMIGHSYSFFTSNFTGALIQRIGRFARAFEKLFDTLNYNILPLATQIIGVVAIVYTKQPMLSLFILVWIVIVMSFSYFYARWRLKYNIAAAKADSATTALIADNITNHNTIATFATESFETESVRKIAGEQQQATFRAWKYSEYLTAVQSGFLVIIEFLLFYYGIKYWQQGSITVGTFVLIQVYILGLSYQLFGFSSVVRAIYESFADSKEMVDILNMPHEVSDIAAAQPLEIKGGSIEFKNTSFSFNGSRKVLDNIVLSIKPGEKVALIGPSGAGKSTVVKLLLRMYNLAQGEITIDGQDIQKVTQNSLRENVSLVPQDPILFHRSLLDNIKYGKKDATDEEVYRAAKLAHCDEFIDPLPDKYNTFVGERGIKLSGGERQRVAIARAILKNAPILVLDEATSSLDSHSEALIQDALDKLMEGKTTIVIAHRLSTIRKMDRIIVLEKGRIIEEGTHDDLTSRKESLYKNLWSLQAGGFLVDEENTKE